MNKLLLLALPLALAACTGQAPAEPPVATAEAANAQPEDAKPADAAKPIPPADPNAAVAFRAVGPIQAVGVLPTQHWVLHSAKDAKGQSIDALFVRANKPLTLDFKASQLSVGNACNAMSGAFKLSASKLVLEALASTKKACAEPGLAALDQAIGSRLTGELGLRMARGAAPMIELTNAAGDVMVFAGSETADSRYGGPGERIFLELSPDAKACAKDKNIVCVPMREIHYDDKGLKVGTPGPFVESDIQIEGFFPRPGVRSVLRVNRYPLKTPASNGSNYAYVLDMVVEVEAVQSAEPAAGKPAEDKVATPAKTP